MGFIGSESENQAKAGPSAIWLEADRHS
jgi:hypothetical protein